MLGTGTDKSLYEKLCCTGAGNVEVVVIATAISFFREMYVFDSTLARRDTRTKELARPTTPTGFLRERLSIR
jgi:hypothetical protein